MDGVCTINNIMYSCKVNNIMYMLIIHGANNLMHDIHRMLTGYYMLSCIILHRVYFNTDIVHENELLSFRGGNQGIV